jgi:hypothetical protein
MTEQIGDEKTATRRVAPAKGKANVKGKAATTLSVAPEPASARGSAAVAESDVAAGSVPADGSAALAAPATAAASAAAGESAAVALPATASAAVAESAAAAVASPVTASASAPVFETRHAVMRYTTLRLALFLVALLLVWGVAAVFDMDLSSQLSKLTLLAVALLLSSAASFVVLSKQRDAMSAGIVARTERLSKRFDDAASLEDDEDE